MIFFWGIFWLLNGLDKFFNGAGFFGVTRDEKFIAYFASINIPSEAAIVSLYCCGVFETLLGVLFLSCLIKSKWTVNAALYMKLGMLVFVTFSFFDILFGDRKELWEHSTFLTMTLVSWLFFDRINTGKGSTANHVLP